MGLLQWVPIGMNIEIVQYKDLDNGLCVAPGFHICVCVCIWNLCLYVYLYLELVFVCVLVLEYICINIVLARTKTVQCCAPGFHDRRSN